MKLSVRHRCSDFASYRAARVKSLFNAESGCNFSLDADLDVDDGDWRLGLIVGPSGSGKTSLGRQVFGPDGFYSARWPDDMPIIDAIAPQGDFNAVTAALASVGLGTVPAWPRPYAVLSTGERFRADLARAIVEAPARVVIDEFTSVVDRQIARFGALAFGKAWRRTGGQCVLLSCHYDIIDWLEPDWVFDTSSGAFTRGRLWRRPAFELEVWQTNWSYWRLFRPHHYLDLPPMIGGRCYVGAVDGEPVCHLAISSINAGRAVEARACRLVVMPEWQGAGVGLRFLNWVCELQRQGGPRARLPGRKVTTLFHTSHPGLVAALRRDPKWVQVSARLYGANKRRSSGSMRRARGRRAGGRPVGGATAYGGHFRAVQGFRYWGETNVGNH